MSRKYPYPSQKGLEFPGGGGGLCKTQKFKEMHSQTKLYWEFPEVIGGGGVS